jgi:hypothetical protein
MEGDNSPRETIRPVVTGLLDANLHALHSQHLDIRRRQIHCDWPWICNHMHWHLYQDPVLAVGWSKHVLGLDYCEVDVGCHSSSTFGLWWVFLKFRSVLKQCPTLDISGTSSPFMLNASLNYLLLFLLILFCHHDWDFPRPLEVSRYYINIVHVRLTSLQDLSDDMECNFFYLGRLIVTNKCSPTMYAPLTQQIYRPTGPCDYWTYASTYSGQTQYPYSYTG